MKLNEKIRITEERLNSDERSYERVIMRLLVGSYKAAPGYRMEILSNREIGYDVSAVEVNVYMPRQKTAYAAFYIELNSMNIQPAGTQDEPKTIYYRGNFEEHKENEHKAYCAAADFMNRMEQTAPEAATVTPDEPEAEDAAQEAAHDEPETGAKTYKVGFIVDGIAQGNMAVAGSAEDVEAYYSGEYGGHMEAIAVREAAEWEIEEDRRRGMPFIKVPAAKPETPAVTQEAAPETEAGAVTEATDEPEPKAGMKFDELPESVQGKVKETLRAYDDCSVTYERGAYRVGAGVGVTARYAPDFKVCGRYAADDIFAPGERVLNYANSFYEYPPEYSGRRDYRMMKAAQERGAKLEYDSAGNIVAAA